MIRWRAAWNILANRSGQGRSLDEASSAVDILEPASTEAAPPLAVLPGMLDRVTSGVPGHQPVEAERATARSTV
ncbi:MAG: hypothetical protein ACXIU7_10885 [Roseinatronobacter sp.]